MNDLELEKLIKNTPYKTKYEPIIEVKTQNIFAYEALAKFEIPENTINTEAIFRYLHHNNALFYELEKRNKILQLENALDDYPVFVNFDADIFTTQEQQKYWESFLAKYKDKIVVEITENGSDDEKSAHIMRDFSLWLTTRGIATALDDFAQEGSMFSFFIMNNSQYIKIDKSFLHQIRLNKNFQYYLQGLVKTIHANGQKSIIEGVETKEDFEFVKELGTDYMQGYYFDYLTQIK